MNKRIKVIHFASFNLLISYSAESVISAQIFLVIYLFAQLVYIFFRILLTYYVTNNLANYNSITFLSGILLQEIVFELFHSAFAWDTQLYRVLFKTCSNLL